MPRLALNLSDQSQIDLHAALVENSSSAEPDRKLLLKKHLVGLIPLMDADSAKKLAKWVKVWCDRQNVGNTCRSHLNLQEIRNSPLWPLIRGGPRRLEQELLMKRLMGSLIHHSQDPRPVSDANRTIIDLRT